MLESFKECANCEQQWLVPDTLDSWYLSYRKWALNGKCSLGPKEQVLNGEFIRKQFFYGCLSQYLRTLPGSNYINQISFDKISNTIVAT